MNESLDAGLDRRVFIRGVGWVGAGLVMGLFGGCDSWNPLRRNSASPYAPARMLL